MHDILPLENSVLPYPWGSRTRIAALLGQPPAEEPQAELWMGAHPKAPSKVVVAGVERRLDELIAERPAEILGPHGAGIPACGAERLPFLLKVLAADRALSIQAHPDLAQAAAGFAREDAQGVPLEAEERNYRDRCHKPEVLFAVEPFSILRGFRRRPEILELADGLGLESLLPALGELRRCVSAGGSASDSDGDNDGDNDAAGLQAFFAATLAISEKRVRRFNEKVVAAVHERGLEDHPVYRWLPLLADQFPADRGVLSPLFLHVLRLEPGEAIYTGPGILHAYLEGLGVELMANSDNVLRGGLTTKHLDVAELMSILRFEAQDPELLAPEIGGPGTGATGPAPEDAAGELRFAPPVEDFALTLVPLAAGEPRRRRAGHGVEILFVLRGEGFLESASGARRSFRGGDSFLVPAAAGGYRLAGEATLFRAEPGRPQAG